MSQLHERLQDSAVVVDSSGSKIGKLAQVYLDNQTGEPSFITVHTGLFGTSESFIPVRDATIQGDVVQVPYTHDQIKAAPHLEGDREISPDEEDTLYRHYGLLGGGGTFDTAETTEQYPTDQYSNEQYSNEQNRIAPDRTDRHTEPDQHTEPQGDYLVRSEEQLDVRTERVAAKTARLRKYVVTEEKTITVPVQREVVRLEEVPIDDAAGGGAAGEPVDQTTVDAVAASGQQPVQGGPDLILNEERIVVEKQTVPVERVRMATETVSGQQEVRSDVRKEAVDVDVDQANPGSGPR